MTGNTSLSLQKVVSCYQQQLTNPHFAEGIYLSSVRLQLHGATYRPDSFVMMPRYCTNLKAIRYESTSLNRIVVDKSHCIIVQFIAAILL